MSGRASVVTVLRADPPTVHGGGQHYFGLEWPTLEWLEGVLTPDMRTLETGSGGSTIVFAGAGCQHVAISPDADEHERVRVWCAAHGISTEHVSFLAQPSDQALMETWTPLEPFDLVLLDGAHSFPFPTLDWYLTATHLRVGGRVVLDDAFLPSVNVVVRFMFGSPSWLREPLPGYRAVCFRKLDHRVVYDWVGGRFDRRPRFNYLPLRRRLIAGARHRVLDRHPAILRAGTRRALVARKIRRR